MSTRTTVVWVPDWPVVAAAAVAQVPGHLPAAVHDGRVVTAVSALARAEGVRRGMRRRQAQGCCPELVLLPADDARDVRLFEPVAAAAQTVVAGVEVARPGLLLLPAGGASRYHGSEDLLAARLVDAVAAATGYECGVGTADGLLAAVLAARTGAVVEPGASPVFLAAHGVGELVHAAVTDDQAAAVGELVDLLHRLGLRTLGELAALPAPSVHARFGRLGSWAHLLARGSDERPPVRHRPEPDLEVSAELDPPLHRVDAAAFAGRRLAERLHEDLVRHGVSCGRLQIAARTDEGVDLVRTWRTDLGGAGGGWGGLTPARITDRVRWQLDGWLTTTAVATARDQARDRFRGRPVLDDAEAHGGVSSGSWSNHRRDEEEPDSRAPEDDHPVGLVRLTLTALDVAPAGAEQGRLWGGPSGGDLRAHRALDRAQSLVGGGGVLTGALQGGRDVREQVHLQPWGEHTLPHRAADLPWPGRLPEPAPASVPAEPVPVRLADPTGLEVRVDERARMSGPPALVRWPAAAARGDGQRGDAREGARGDGTVVGWAGPWLLTERWWQHPGRPPQLRVHLQVTLDDGRALLLAGAGDGWVCEATYD